MTNGRTLEGRVVFETDTTLVLLQGSKERELARSEIESVRSLKGSLEQLLASSRMLPWLDSAANLELARFCEDRGLAGEAEALRWLALLHEPESTRANEALGNLRRGEEWLVPNEGRYVSFERLRETRREWREAWELSSLHYTLTTNLELEQAIEVLFDLERFYRHFYKTLGAHLELREVVGRMEVHIYADGESFPRNFSNRHAYYSPEIDRIYVDAEGTLLRQSLFHEATHQLLDVTSTGFSDVRQVPAWLDEGLAEYLATGGVGLPGRMEFREGVLAGSHAHVHAQAEEPLSLKRVLNLSTAEFYPQDSALMYAQSYTLVFYCMQGEDGRLRRGFFDYLGGVFASKSSSTSFFEQLGREADELEAAWQRWVLALTGRR